MSEGLLDKPDILVRIIGKYYTKYQAESIAGRIPFEKFSDHNKMKGVNLAELKAIKFRPAGVSVGSSKEGEAIAKAIIGNKSSNMTIKYDFSLLLEFLYKFKKEEIIKILDHLNKSDIYNPRNPENDAPPDADTKFVKLQAKLRILGKL